MTHSRRSTPPVTGVAVVTAVGLILAGCGGSSGSTDSATETLATFATVGGPSTAAATVRGRLCGQTRGPDGALFVHVLGQAPVDCAVALRVAQEFGAKMAAAKPVTVDGWSCTFPTSPGLLGRCDNGDQAFGMFSSR